MAYKNFWHLLFYKSPIRSEARAYLGVTGTLKIFNPPLEKNPPSLF
jgi:hypothetical protein